MFLCISERVSRGSRSQAWIEIGWLPCPTWTWLPRCRCTCVGRGRGEGLYLRSTLRWRSRGGVPMLDTRNPIVCQPRQGPRRLLRRDQCSCACSTWQRRSRMPLQGLSRHDRRRQSSTWRARRVESCRPRSRLPPPPAAARPARLPCPLTDCSRTSPRRRWTSRRRHRPRLEIRRQMMHVQQSQVLAQWCNHGCLEQRDHWRGKLD